jgi:hypothetical protein
MKNVGYIRTSLEPNGSIGFSTQWTWSLEAGTLRRNSGGKQLNGPI